MLVGHDLPQHLAYVRLLSAWGDPALQLDTVYLPPDLADPYTTLYRPLAWLARAATAESAARMAYCAYALGLSISFAWLARVVRGLSWREPCGASLFGPLVVWNPVLCMGFLPFQLALVPLVAATAGAILWVHVGGRRWLGAALALIAFTTLLHGVAGAFATGIALLGALLYRGRRAPILAASAVVVWAGCMGWFRPHALSNSPGLLVTLGRNVDAWGVWQGFRGTFRVTFTPWGEKAAFLFSHLAGPFPRTAQLAILFGVLAFAAFGVLTRQRDASFAATSNTPLRSFRWVCLIMIGLACLAPGAVQVPDDICLFDFRLATVASILVVAGFAPRAPEPTSQRATLALACWIIGWWGRELRGTAYETMATVRLVSGLNAHDRLLALPMHDTSAHLDPSNTVLHYAAVYHTVRNAGVTSLFWGKFVPRLPIGYRAGAEPPHPADWSPWDVREEDISRWTHVLASFPESDDEVRAHELAARVEGWEREGRVTRLVCEGRSCLYRVGDPHDGPHTIPNSLSLR